MIIIPKNDLDLDIPNIRPNFPNIKVSLQKNSAVQAVRFDYLAYGDRIKFRDHLGPQNINRVYFFFVRGHVVCLPKEYFQAPQFYQGRYNI